MVVNRWTICSLKFALSHCTHCSTHLQFRISVSGDQFVHRPKVHESVVANDDGNISYNSVPCERSDVFHPA